jgi:hypothetical protein
MSGPISISAYAKSRGISQPAVTKAIKTGRIAKSIVRDARGNPKIADPALADKEWAANTDQSKPRNRITGDPKRRKAAGEGSKPMQLGVTKTVTPSEGATEGAGSGGGGASYAQSRSIREAYMARLAKLEFDERSGKLLEIEKIRATIFAATRAARDMLLAVPDRVAPLAVGTEQHEINRILTDEMRRVCAELAKLKF